MFYEVVPVGKVEALTYDFDDLLVPGQIVLVPLGRRTVPGVVIKKVAQPDFKTRAILKVLYTEPLPRHLLSVVKFFTRLLFGADWASGVGGATPRDTEKAAKNRTNVRGWKGQGRIHSVSFGHSSQATSGQVLMSRRVHRELSLGRSSANNPA